MQTEQAQTAQNEQSLEEFMRASPLFGHEEIEFGRDRSAPREVDFQY